MQIISKNLKYLIDKTELSVLLIVSYHTLGGIMKFRDFDNRHLTTRELSIWAILLAAGLFMLIFGITHEGIWYDESYSIAAVDNTFFDLVGMIGRDSHPPLYFVMLKIFVTIFGKSILTLRLFSALSIFSMGVLGFTHIRKLISNRVGLIYSAMIFLTPVSVFQAQETRMYALCGAFVMIAMILLFYAINQNSFKTWIAGSIAAYAAALTHYYGLIAVTILYALLLGYFIICNCDLVKRLVITCILLVVFYSPVFYMLVYQTSRISKGFWIDPISLSRALSLFTYYFGYKFEMPFTVFTTIASILAVVFLCLTIVSFYKNRKQTDYFAVISIILFFLTILAGLVLSAAFRPILISRYITAVFGPFLFAMAYGINSLKKPELIASSVILYIIATSPVLYGIYSNNFNGPMNIVYDSIKGEVNKDDIFIHGSEHTFGTFYVYFPDNKHFLYIPEDHNPYSNYEVFELNGDYGVDFNKYLDMAKTRVWLTNRPGDPTNLSAVEILKHPHMKSECDVSRFNTKMGWYEVELSSFRYTHKKDPSDSPSYGDLQITITGIRGNDPVYWGFFNSEPLDSGNVMTKGRSSVADGKATIYISGLKFGRYAIFGWQDLNEDIRWNSESEGNIIFGKSPKKFGDPLSLEENGFDFDDNNSEYTIEMRYP